MIVAVLQGLLALAAAALVFAWLGNSGPSGERPRTGPLALAIGAVVNFFDTLGIGSFAPSTALIKLFRLARDEKIPGTLNVGHSIPTIAQALIFIAIVNVDVALLISCIGAAVAGAVLGAGVVSRMPVRTIRLGMGAALLVAAGLFIARNLGLMPGGGDALALSGAAFVAAVALHFIFGALMTLGIGLYAPALISLSILGMDPRAAFPIMMGACAFLMPTASLRFIEAKRFYPKLALGFAIGGVPAVLVAALIVKEMPLDLLRWMVAAVVILAAGMMLASGLKPEEAPARAN
ncbi:MAG: permease [Parvularculaceae bacterium]|nr:permease [Parvularculaceae bacterium]